MMKTSGGKKDAVKFIIGVDAGKEAILYGTTVEEKGPRYMHFPILQRSGYDMEYFRGLVSERMVIHRRGGVSVIAWEKTYERNEPLDCRNYARAAYKYFNWNFDKYKKMIAGEKEPPTVERARDNAKQRKTVVSGGIKL
jgi:phage terminase large subunit GpA-like protein